MTLELASKVQIVFTKKPSKLIKKLRKKLFKLDDILIVPQVAESQDLSDIREVEREDRIQKRIRRELGYVV